MKEKIHTIPVNDAFDAKSECPVCSMYRDLERRALDFVLGPSYMEDDIRTKTNELGFCGTHLKMLLSEKNSHIIREYLEYTILLLTIMDLLIRLFGMTKFV